MPISCRGWAMPATACSAPSKGRVRRANEARILRAAERVFADSGFAGARMAEIAAAAGVPKANLHYYFRSKRAIYRAVLDNILDLWLAETASITATAEPGAALAQYIRAKMRFSRRYPEASRVFANEIIHGAKEIGGFLRGDMKALIDGKSAIIKGWIEDGRMAAIEPRHLFVAIWALTQTFADFAAQVHAVMGIKSLSEAQFAAATEEVVALILRGCAIDLATARTGDKR
jgi:TetR/AcrR family transcriptional regulator